MKANLMTKKIEMAKSEAKEAGKLNTEKFHELRQYMAIYPGYEIQIVAPAKRKVELRGLDYKYMRTYILSHDDEQHSKMEKFKTLIAQDIEELISKVRLWNYELLVSVEEGEQRKEIMEDAAVLDELEDMISERTGYPLGYLTVKELIGVLSKMPEDYRVTCCGADNYLYLFAKDKYITIDNEERLL